MAKVAFIYTPSKHWLGGKNYYLSLFSDLNKSNFSHQIYIFTGKDYESPELEAFVNLNVIRSNILNKKFTRFHQICNLFVSENLYLLSIFKKYKINFLSHSYISKITGIKSIPWIPDFQHNYLPELFKKKELRRRDSRIKKYLDSGPIIVSSKSAYEDAFKFFSPTNNIHIYRFKPLPVTNHNSVTVATLENVYNVSFPFIFLPNQFWKHKNHLIVFDAIAKLKTKGININLVCTGAFSDYRNPEYSDTIKERITSLGISDNINLLGMVDRDVFNSLLGESALLINPSLFEGWSTTVEEGKMASKSMLLSDIPVHREQVETYPVETLFFSPSSIDSCSEQLVHAMKSIIEPSRKVNPEYCEHHTYTEILNRIINESN